ncbi:Hypothetical predicted protein [Lecanosticta acicola]|uniref:Uncharacterized protein n=1 Tax=Lecanosticta acicola TaxID=111012 RepID=A0AAI9EEJ6_9PEZI|nr:Hypothetical predicted protein [Lecanosticta acicola]
MPGPFPGGLPSPSRDNDTAELSMDMLLFDQNMSFVGNNDGYGSFYPMWSSPVDNDLTDPSKHNNWNLPTPPPVADMHQLPFPNSWSDASITRSPTTIEARLNGFDSRNGSSDHTGSLGASSTIVQSPMQCKDQGDGSYFMFPASLPNFYSGNFRNSQDSRPSTTASAMSSFSTFPSGQVPNSFTQTNTSPMPLLPSRCSCYSSILQRLSELKDEKAKFLSTRIDTIMKLEKDVRIQTQTMLKCDMCTHERSRSLLLASVLLESMIDLLEGVPASDSRRPVDARSELAILRRQSMPAYMHSNTETGRLVLGEYEISGEEKLGFLRHLLHTRLNELANLTRQLQEHTETLGPGSTAILTILAGCSQRIHAIMSRLQN